MLVQGSPIELVSVRESLGPCTLPHGDQPVLVRVQHSALLPHRLWVGDGGRKEPIIFNSAIEASPLVVTIAGGKNRIHSIYILKAEPITWPSQSSY